MKHLIGNHYASYGMTEVWMYHELGLNQKVYINSNNDSIHGKTLFEKMKKDLTPTSFIKVVNYTDEGDYVLGGLFKYKDDFYVWVDEIEKIVTIVFGNNDTIGEIVNFLNETIPKTETEEKESSIYLLKREKHFYLNKHSFPKIELDFNNYNESFKEFHEYTLKKLETENGIVILFSDPGHGKTSYIKGLISILKDTDRKIIYLPPYLTSSLSDPGILDFILKQKNAIFVVEDAEECLQKREGRDTAVSNILNFSDGILGDIANISFIFTINTDIREIDPALLRKGRLISKYEFKELEESRANALKKKIGAITDSCLLADIYNASNKDFSQKTTAIGYGRKT